MQLAMERCIVGDHRRHATTTSHLKLQFLYQWADKGFIWCSAYLTACFPWTPEMLATCASSEQQHSSTRASKLQLWIILLTC